MFYCILFSENVTKKNISVTFKRNLFLVNYERGYWIMREAAGERNEG